MVFTACLDEELTDEFFELTETDVRRMWQDLQKQT